MADTIVSLGFAVFGLSYLLAYTDGPWDLIYKFREFLISKDSVQPEPLPVYDGEGEYVYISEEQIFEGGFFFKLFGCFWCTSFWIAILINGLHYLSKDDPGNILPYVIIFFASIGFSGLLHEFTE